MVTLGGEFEGEFGGANVEFPVIGLVPVAGMSDSEFLVPISRSQRRRNKSANFSANKRIELEGRWEFLE